MTIISETIYLDASRGGVQARIFVKQGDSGSRAFKAELYQKGKRLSLSGLTAAFYADTNGETVVTDCTIENNCVSCAIPSSVISAAGIVPCELVLFDSDGHSLTSPRFEIVSEDALYDENAVTASNDYSALTSALARANRFSAVSASASTLAAESSATVSSEIGASGVSFAFGIPRGDKGEKGDKGDAGDGSGDMLKSVYDSSGLSQDVFAYARSRADAVRSECAPLSHAQSTANPHGVTASQINAAPLSHVADSSNPHGVTAAQTGAVSQTLSEGNITASSFFTDSGSTAVKLGRAVFLHIMGSAVFAASDSKTIAVVPEGYRPASQTNADYVKLGGRSGEIAIQTGGNVIWTNKSGSAANGDINFTAVYIAAN